MTQLETNYNLIVCDNRDVKNWGCRATSISLGQFIFMSSNRKQKYLHRGIAANRHPVGAMPEIINRSTFGPRLKSFAIEACSRYLPIQCPKIFGRRDFLGNTPSESLSNFWKFKKHDNLLHSLFKLFDNANKVIINGEGSMIFTYPPRRDLDFQLFCIELASSLGKPVYYLNAMTSDCPKSGRNKHVVENVLCTLPKADGVLLRDPYSFELLKSLGFQARGWAPDALFTWSDYYSNFFDSYNGPMEIFDAWPESDHFISRWSDYPQDYISIGGASRPPGVAVKDWIPFFIRLIRTLRKASELPIILVDGSGDDFLAAIARENDLFFVNPQTNVLAGAYILSNAKAYLSGRYHPSIMASLGGTPCIFLPSNSHKTLSLQSVMGYDSEKVFEMQDSDDLIDGIVDDLFNKIDMGVVLRSQIISRCQENSSTFKQSISSMLGPWPELT